MVPNESDNPQCALLDLSAKVEYALIALIELASHPHPRQPLTINEIASRQPIPERYLEQIFSLLRQGGVIHSQRGARGGYMLSKEPWQVTVLEVLLLMEGNRKNRALNNHSSVERELVHEMWQQANSNFQAALSECTLKDLCHRRDMRKQINPMYYI